jgi:hypothetical protein
MNKDETLEKYQIKNLNNPDEIELQVTQKGSKIAVISILAFSLIMMIIKIIAKQPWYDLYSICFVSIGVQNFYKGLKLNQRYSIILGIAFTTLSIFIAVGYISQVI